MFSAEIKSIKTENTKSVIVAFVHRGSGDNEPLYKDFNSIRQDESERDRDGMSNIRHNIIRTPCRMSPPRSRYH